MYKIDETDKKIDLHTHTVYSDGVDEPEDMVLSAIEKGLDVIGISDHAYTSFDESYCIPKERLPEYKVEIARLRKKYADKIDVRLGVEQDYYSDLPANGFDYVIGSVHYIKAPLATKTMINDKSAANEPAANKTAANESATNEPATNEPAESTLADVSGNIYIPVDESAEILKAAADKYYDGDMYSLVEEYYHTVSNVIDKTGADIIGHFDLITKFIEKTPLFDTNHPRYAAAWKSAADKLLEAGIPFEINTGAISRGYRTTPYPANEIVRYIKEHGGLFIQSSDSHSALNISFGFTNNSEGISHTS